MAAPDTSQIIYEYVTATGTDLYTAIGTRAWDDHPEADVWANESAALVFGEVSKDDPANGQLEDVTVEFRCYGGTRAKSDAQNVARWLYERLHAQGGRTDNGYIHRAYRVGQQDLTDPDTGWPFTLARYSMMIED